MATFRSCSTSKISVILHVDPATSALSLTFDNDSSMVTKSSQMTEFNLGYSRQAFTNDKGSLYLGAEARLYLMQLSRLSVRFGDITDSDELFDAIRDAEFRDDQDMGVDVGALSAGADGQHRLPDHLVTIVAIRRTSIG